MKEASPPVAAGATEETARALEAGTAGADPVGAGAEGTGGAVPGGYTGGANCPQPDHCG